MAERDHTVATLTVLTVLCLFGVLLGVRALTEPFPDAPLSTDLTETCQLRVVREGERIGPHDVLVSVFNASSENGLARNTLIQLSERGFGSGTEGNVEAPRVRYAEVWADEADNPAALLVARQFGPRVSVRTGKDTGIGEGVIVIVGDRFEELRRGPKFVEAPYDTEVCSPTVT